MNCLLVASRYINELAWIGIRDFRSLRAGQPLGSDTPLRSVPPQFTHSAWAAASRGSWWLRPDAGRLAAKRRESNRDLGQGGPSGQVGHHSLDARRAEPYRHVGS